MSSRFLKRRMENCEGDLADIVGATTTAGGTSAVPVYDWHIIPSDDPINYLSYPTEDFGDPFTSFMGDPLLQDMDSPVSGFFHNSSNIMIKACSTTVDDDDDDDGNGGHDTASGSSINIAHQDINVDDQEMKRPSSVFSRMLQISSQNNARLPAVSPFESQLTAAPILLSCNNPTPRSSRSSSYRGRLVESAAAAAGMQISSPRITGIKRIRKSQAKKVVCIPAPAPVNSKAGGEVVPSDLWAWRKYGQKPIKGSPYPRGYYRCSSSKGCSARKQVERSRTDPNMLVITYTSEHNHPWPTQRNALAGSTRSQPSKNTCVSKTNSANPPEPANSEKEQKKENTLTTPTPTPTPNSANVKEEIVSSMMDHEFIGNDQLEMDVVEFDDRGFPNIYIPTLKDSNHSEDTFFSELGEIGDDPLESVFGFYDWATSDGNITASTITTTAAPANVISSTTSYGEANLGNS
ncbi:WRKY Transcription Factor [Orobanche hederae]